MCVKYNQSIHVIDFQISFLKFINQFNYKGAILLLCCKFNCVRRKKNIKCNIVCVINATSSVKKYTLSIYVLYILSIVFTKKPIFDVTFST